MKAQLRTASLSLLALFCLMLAGSALATDLYDNGPINADQDAWTVNFGFQVTDSFILQHAATVRGFQFAVWEIPGDSATKVDWSIGTSPFSNTFGGTACAVPGPGCNSALNDTFLFTNAFGYSIDLETVTGLNLPLAGNTTYYLTLQNAETQLLNQLYWDENSGRSLAYENDYGSIPSESFTINGGTTPEPSTLMLFGSGILGLGGLLRRRFLG
jgi:PEP-CTERM motif